MSPPEQPKGGAPPEQPARPPRQPAPAQMDYRQNLRMQQQVIQGRNIEQFNKLRRTKKKGIEVQSAF